MAKIIGGVAATNMPVPDWNQTNPLRADYIKNKPDVITRDNIGDFVVPTEKAEGFNDETYEQGTFGSVTTDRPSQFSGLTIVDGEIMVCPATEESILSQVTTMKDGEYHGYNAPITPYNLNYAVKLALAYNHLTLTDEEKESARTLLGAGEPVAVDQYLDEQSTNPVANYAVMSAFQGLLGRVTTLENMAELSPKKVVFEDGATITVENNTCYCAEAPISTLNVIYPQTDFICSFLFTIADEGNVTISLPQSKYIGGTPSFANGETWEVNIKDGVVVGGLVE